MNNLPSPNVEILKPLRASVLKSDPPWKISKQEIRTSLTASTMDGVFAAIFANVTTGVLLINFLLKLDATPVQIGFLSSIPMVVNFLQPVGAYIADRTQSRRRYIIAFFGLARLLWLILVGGIGWLSWSGNDPHYLVTWTLGIIFFSNILGALGLAAWLSWMAALVPRRLRGRYFGLRNSAASLTNLLCVPLLGLALCAWPGGTIQGYGVLLLVGVVIGLVSLACQSWMTDVNPQITNFAVSSDQQEENAPSQPKKLSILKDMNFLRLLLYFGLWTFALNLSSPFFNLYMLKDLALDVSTVTFYTSFLSGANIAMLVLWGKLADRVGNRPVLLLVGIVMAVIPVLWLGVGTDSVSVWVWIPLIHILSGSFTAGYDLCYGNIQMSLAPMDRPAQYFAIAAAVTGVSGGLGSTLGGFLAGLDIIGGLRGLFALSAVLRLIALLALLFVQEPRSQPVVQVLFNILHFKHPQTLVKEGG